MSEEWFYPYRGGAASNGSQWVIDWSKVTKWEDLRELLKGCEFRPKSEHPDFVHIRHLCKLIDMDGRDITPDAIE